MRIVAGRFRGRAIASPADESVRPTSDRVRESLFNVLEHGIAGFSLSGVRVIDLFAGTGALGLDPTIVRFLYAALTLLSAAFPGIIIYILLWILMPREPE